MRWSVRDIRGAGISLQSIIDQQLPVPHRDMVPVSLEEQGYLLLPTSFFSKGHIWTREKKRGEGVKEYFTLWGRWDNPF